MIVPAIIVINQATLPIIVQPHKGEIETNKDVLVLIIPGLYITLTSKTRWTIKPDTILRMMNTKKNPNFISTKAKPILLPPEVVRNIHQGKLLLWLMNWTSLEETPFIIPNES